MKHLSQETQELIQQLQELSRSWTWNILSGERKFNKLLADVEQAREAAAILFLSPLVFRQRLSVAQATAGTIAELLKSYGPSDYLDLDRKMRGYSYYTDFVSLEPEEVGDFREFAEFAWVPRILASMNGRGYVRERAIKGLLTQKVVPSLPFLLLRVNDWVTEVREQAVHGVEQFLSPQFSKEILESLPLLLRLRSSRAQAEQVVESALSVLIDPLSSDAFRQGLNHQDRNLRREIYALAFSRSTLDRASLLEKALEDPDILIRASAIDAVSQIPSQEERLGILKRAFCDPHMLIRQKVLDSLSQSPYQSVHSLVAQGIFDNSATIRQTCRSIIKRNESVANKRYFLNLYQKELSGQQSARLATSLLGIGEIGEIGDSDLAKDFLKHPAARVRKAAIWTIAQLEPRKYEEEFWRLLLQDTPGVAKESARALLKIHSHSIGVVIWSHFAASSNVSLRTTLLWLLNQLPKWEKFSFLILASGDSHLEIRNRSLEYLRSWIKDFNQNIAVPSAEESDRARAALDAIKGRFPEGLERSLEFYLKGL